MVIFGAGASNDSLSEPVRRATAMGRAFERENSAGLLERADRLDWQPPLTADLFKEKPQFQRAIANYPAAGTLIDGSLRGLDPKTNSVETVLDSLSTEAAEPSAASLRRQLAALRFYLREVLWQCGDNFESEIGPAQTNYHRLVERIVRWQERRQAAGGETVVTLVTFNYDLMLDRAVRTHARLDLSMLDGYVARKDFQYFKPHGSVNWALETDISPTFSMSGTYSPQELVLGSELLIEAAGASPASFSGVSRWHVIDHWQQVVVGNSTLGFPALTVPIVSKDTFEMPVSHIERLREATLSVTHLLVVGWRSREKNFLNLWADERRYCRPLLQVVGRRSAAETIDALDNAGIPSRSVPPVIVGFSGYMGGAYADDSELYRFVDTPI